MGKAIITFLITLIIGVLAEATIGTMFNMIKLRLPLM